MTALTVALLLLLVLVSMFSAISQASAAGGPLTVEILAGYNLVVDSNVRSPSTNGPSAATVAGRVCNTGSDPVTDVVVYIGNAAANTPGVYPGRNSSDSAFQALHPALGPGHIYSFTHSGGSLGLGDATRQAGILQPGQCTVQYWTLVYPRCENSENPPCSQDAVWGDSARPEDDLWLTFDVWARGYDGTATINATNTWTMTMRNEISAMANKIQPNGNPGGLWFNTDTNSIEPGGVITTNGILYRMGNVGFGFDNNGDYVPDNNFWMQPVGDAASFDPGCFRLIRTSGIITIVGGTPTTINFVDKLYFTRPDVPPDNTNVIGEVFYTFLALGNNCTSSPTPYQVAASGYDNEKFNAGYGAGGGSPMVNEAAVVGIDKSSNPDLLGVGQIVTYTLPFWNASATEPASLILYQGAYVNNPLVISDSIPSGTLYRTGSATYTLNFSPNTGVTIRYSTNGGQTWSDTEPVSGVTTIQWWLKEPLPPSTTGSSAKFSVLIPITYTSGPVIENCANLQFDNGPSVAGACKSVVLTGTALIGNEVWRDEDNNGQLNPGEPYVSGPVTVWLYWDKNSDGKLDSSDKLIMTTTTGIASTGLYSFTNLYTGAYLVKVDKTDPDIPFGYRLNTNEVYAVYLTSTNILTADFGFGPSLDAIKTIGGSCYARDTVAHNLTVRNIRSAGGETVGGGCRYTFWAQDLSGSQNTWFNTGNLVGAAGPDGAFAHSSWANNADIALVTNFGVVTQSGVISTVEVMAQVYINGSLTDDAVQFAVYSNTAELTRTTYITQLDSFAGAGNQGLLIWRVPTSTLVSVRKPV